MGPIIGILTRSGVNENGTPIEYCMESTRRAIIKAGGVPIMLTPPQDIDYFTTKSSEAPDLTGMEQEKIKNGQGIIAVPVEEIGNYLTKLTLYYESGDNTNLKQWIYENCIDGV